MKKLIALTLPLLCAGVALAAGDSHGDGHIPVKAILVQAGNFGAFLLLIYFVSRKKVAAFLVSREERFHQARIKAEAARAEAEKTKREIQTRLAQLEATAATSVSQARAEAEELKKKITQEARSLAKNLREEATRTAQNEIERAKFELRTEMLKQSMDTARKILGEKMAEPDQKRLQNEFVEKIQVVRS